MNEFSTKQAIILLIHQQIMRYSRSSAKALKCGDLQVATNDEAVCLALSELQTAIRYGES